MIDYRLLNLKPWSPVGQCITVNWCKRYGYVPASQTPEIAEKHRFFREFAINDANRGVVNV